MPARRRLLLVALVLVAGCTGRPPVAADEATERALAAEEEYISTRLDGASCVDGWSLRSYVGLSENATVHNTTDDAVYVDVTHPYTYATETVNADIASEATYRVTANETERVAGTDVSPC